jgi:peroxiredoxin
MIKGPWNGREAEIMSAEIKTGSAAPDFSLPNYDGREIRLADYRGQSQVVLFFVREYN